MATKTHLLARDQAVVGLDEHVLGASQVHAARLQLGGVVHAGHDFLDLLGGNLRGREDAASDLVSGSTNTKHPTFVGASGRGRTSNPAEAAQSEPSTPQIAPCVTCPVPIKWSST